MQVVDGREALLRFLDRDVSAAIAQAMHAAGIQFHWNQRVVGCTAPERGDLRLTLSSGKQLAVTDVLVAGGEFSDS